MKITEMTEAQQEELATFADRFANDCYSTEPCDREKAESAIRYSYKAADLEEPVLMLWAASPRLALIMGPTISELAFGDSKKVCDEIVERAHNSMSEVRNFVDEDHASPFRRTVASIIREHLQGRLVSEHQCGEDQVVEHLLTVDVSALVETCVPIIKERWSEYTAGFRWAGWAGWRIACVEILGLEKTDAYRALKDRAMQCSVAWVGAKVAVMAEHAAEVHRQPDQRGAMVLHNDTGPAVRWAGDVNALWSIEGIAVSKKTVMAPETLTLEEIASEENADVRRIMQDRYGMLRWLEDVKAEKISEDTVLIESWNPAAGSIVRLLVGTPSGEKYVVASDGSTGQVYAMRAPDDAKTPNDFYESVSGSETSKCIAQG